MSPLISSLNWNFELYISDFNRNSQELAYIGLIPSNTYDDPTNESNHPLLPHLLPPPPQEDNNYMRDYRETSITPSNLTTPR